MITDKVYAAYAPALARVEELLQEREENHIKTPVIIGVDGRCGSGKTYFAGQLAEQFPCSIIHMDDFYLPMGQRAADWEITPCGNMDFERLLAEVLSPLSKGRRALYRPYCCRTGAFGEEEELAEKPLVVVEGSYSGHPLLSKAYDLKLFFTCSQKEQAKRLKEREGGRYEVFAARWIPLEETYFERYVIEKESTLTVNTDGLF